MAAATRREGGSRPGTAAAPSPSAPEAAEAAAPEAPSAMASRSGRDSATSCQRVSTTASSLERAAETSWGDGSDSMASRPDAVDTAGRAAAAAEPDPIPGADRTAVAIIWFGAADLIRSWLSALGPWPADTQGMQCNVMQCTLPMHAEQFSSRLLVSFLRRSEGRSEMA